MYYTGQPDLIIFLKEIRKNYKDDILFLEKQHVLPFPILSTLGRLCEYDFRALAAIYNKNTVHVTVTDGFP